MRITLEIQEGPDAGRRIRLPEAGAIRVGRSEEVDFRLRDGFLSQKHFAIEVRNGKCHLRDLNSRNGTFLKGKKISEAELHSGAEIQAGHTTFRLRIEGKVAPPTVKETPVETTTPTSSAEGPVAEPILATLVVPSPEPPCPESVTRPEPVTAAAQQTTVQKIVLPGQTPEGQHILSVLVKRTYAIVPGSLCVRAEKDRKLAPGDVHYGDPMNSPVKFESDFVPFKLATDIVLNGTAYAPRGGVTRSLKVSLRVGSVTKQIDVLGDRVCHYDARGDPTFSDPLPFKTMELRYDLAYGGVDVFSDPKVPCIYARNHLGRGFVVKNIRKSVEKLPLPNLEDPADRLTPERLCVEKFWEWERQPMPASLSWFSKYWRPRALYAGVMPADRLAEQELRAIFAQAVPPEQRAIYEQTKLPDMDFRFFSGASPGLVAPFLRGDEAVQTMNLTPEGRLEFLLPGDRPGIAVDIGGGAQDPEVVLHTVMIRMEDRQVDLVWRGAVPYAGPDSLPELKMLEVIVT